MLIEEDTQEENRWRVSMCNDSRAALTVLKTYYWSWINRENTLCNDHEPFPHYKNRENVYKEELSK